MPKKRHIVRAECPACDYGTVSQLSPEVLRNKFIGDEKEIDVLCPMCGTRHKGEIHEQEEEV
jgi:Zn ribbon nucleic-acid-binding protein